MNQLKHLKPTLVTYLDSGLGVHVSHLGAEYYIIEGKAETIVWKLKDKLIDENFGIFNSVLEAELAILEGTSWTTSENNLTAPVSTTCFPSLSVRIMKNSLRCV